MNPSSREGTRANAARNPDHLLDPACFQRFETGGAVKFRVPLQQEAIHRPGMLPERLEEQGQPDKQLPRSVQLPLRKANSAFWAFQAQHFVTPALFVNGFARRPDLLGE